MTDVSTDKVIASRADVRAARRLFEGSGADATTFDVARLVTDKSEALVFYAGAPVDSADYAITQNTPAAGQTRFTFSFTLEAGVKVKIFV